MTLSVRPLAVVTGTTGGIGGALAPMLAEAGYDLALPVREPSRIGTLVSEMRTKTPGISVTTYDADLSDHAAVRALADHLMRDHTAIAALLNVAGYLSPDLKTSAQGHDLHYELNTLAPLMLAHLLGPALAQGATAHGRAVVVNTSSAAIAMAGSLNVASLPKNPKQGLFGAYGQTKLALTSATHQLAPVYAPAGIDLYAVDPGSNRSAMTKGAGAPFFVRWMSSILPAPQNGSRKIMAPLEPAVAPPGSLIVGAKAKPQPKQAGDAGNISSLMDRLSADAGLPLANPDFT